MNLVNGSVPAEQLQQCLEELRRNPCHPGRLFRESCLYNASLTVAEAALRLGVDPAALEPVLAGRAPLTPELALRIERAGWPRAEIWTEQQAAYDLAQARLRLEHNEQQTDRATLPNPVAPQAATSAANASPKTLR